MNGYWCILHICMFMIQMECKWIVVVEYEWIITVMDKSWISTDIDGRLIYSDGIWMGYQWIFMGIHGYGRILPN